jgi:hypothetical protein
LLYKSINDKNVDHWGAPKRAYFHALLQVPVWDETSR